MNNLSGRLVIYLVGAASLFVILFGIRGLASIINPILLALVITITVLPIPSRLTKRGMPGWLALVVSILLVVLLLGPGHRYRFLLHHQAVDRAADLHGRALRSKPARTFHQQRSETSTQTDQVTIQFGPVAQGMLASVAGLAGPVWLGAGDLLLYDQRRPFAARRPPAWAWTRIHPSSGGSPRLRKISAST